MRAALKHRGFRLVFAGQTVSRIGDHLYQLALAWWVLKKTGSALDMGAVMICSFAPMLVFLLIGGVAVDRLSRIAIMFASDLFRGVLVLGVAGFELAGWLTTWEICLASVLFGCIDAFFNPAYLAAVPDLMPAEHLPIANALTSLSTQLGRIAGPPLAAAFIAAAGIGCTFALNGASFIISAAFLLPLLQTRFRRNAGASPATLDSEAPPARSSLWRDVSEGIGFVRARPWLWLTILSFAAMNVLLAGPYSVTLPFLVSKTLGRGVGTLGLLYAMFPIGYALAALTTGNMKRIPWRGPVIFGSMAVAGAGLAVLGLRVPPLAMLLAAMVNGFALELGALAWTNLMQEQVPAELLGRVSSIDGLGSFALLPVGYILAGWAADHLGPPAVFLVGGATTFLLATAGLCLGAIRRME